MISKEEVLEYPHVLGWYLGYDRLKPFHSEWIKDIWMTKKEIVLQAHRLSYKTTSIVIIGSIWYLLFNPNHRILICRKENAGAVKALKEIRKHYNSAKMKVLYDAFYEIDNFKLIEDNDNRIVLSTKIRITKEGSIEARSIGASITGDHFERIHTDDIITVKDRISKAEREKTKEYVRELRNIVDIGFPLSHTGTPWHKEDAFTIMPKPLQYPIGSLELPEFTPEILQIIKDGTTYSLYCANYELKHIQDEASQFPDPKWIDLPKDFSPRAQIDAGYQGTNTTAMTLFDKRPDEKIFGIGFLWDRNIMNLFERIKAILNKYKVGTIYLEDNADKGFSAREIRKFHPAVSNYHESTNKHVKITAFLGKYWDQVYWSKDTMDDYMVQIVDYIEDEEPDDAPDSAASLLREMGLSAEVIDDDFASNDIDYINEESRV